MGVNITRSDIADALDPAFDEIHETRKKNAVTIFDKIFTILTSERKQEKKSSMTDMANAVEKAEGGEMTPAVYKQKYDETFLHTTFGIYTRITKEAYDDDLSEGKLSRIPSLQFDSCINCVEGKAADVFDTAASTTGPDSQYLIDTDHPTPLSSDTFQNCPDAATDLTVGAVEDSILRQEATETDAGAPMNLKVKYLIVQTANMIKGKKILQSTNTPFEMSNTKNVLQDYNLELLIMRYMTDTDAWFTAAAKEVLQFYFYWRERINKSWMAAPDTSRDVLYMTAMRFSLDYLDWRGIDGSIGA